MNETFEDKDKNWVLFTSLISKINSRYACRKLFDTLLGRGFETHQLHQKKTHSNEWIFYYLQYVLNQENDL